MPVKGVPIPGQVDPVAPELSLIGEFTQNPVTVHFSRVLPWERSGVWSFQRSKRGNVKHGVSLQID